MQFQVPQYIEEDDKIFWMLSFKQAIYIAGGLGISFVIYYFLGSLLFSIPFIVPVLVLSGLLAFYRHNNRPFIFLLEAMFYYMLSDKLFIWKKIPKYNNEKSTEKVEKTTDELSIPRVTQGNIHNLSWKLDMNIDEKNVDKRI